MELPNAAANEVRGNGIDIIHDHRQKQLRDMIESYRFLPNNCSFCELDEDTQEDIKTICRNYKAVCPSSNLNHNCTFRYINNASISKILQPRYECKTCNRTFTLSGRSYYMGVSCKRSLAGSNDDQKCRSNRKKIKKRNELQAAVRYIASDHHEERSYRPLELEQVEKITSTNENHLFGDYPICPNSNINNHQNRDGGGCEQMINEYGEEAEYESKYGQKEITDVCFSIFDVDQTELLDKIISKYDDSSCLWLDQELIDIDSTL